VKKQAETESIPVTRQILLKATRDIIDQQGVDAVSMRELGKRIGLSRSAMYRHFRNKENLLAEIVIEDFEALDIRLGAFLSLNSTPSERMEPLLKAYYDFGTNNQAHYRLMFGREWERSEYPNVYQAAIRIFKRVSEGLGNPGNGDTVATAFAFVHGLIELQFSGHSEPEKNLDDPYRLISYLVRNIKQ
jgi:AcrR family transcriptional regulator